MTRNKVALVLMLVLPVVSWLPVVVLATYGGWWLRIPALLVCPLIVALVAERNEVWLGAGTGVVLGGVTLVVSLGDAMLNGHGVREPDEAVTSMLVICLAVAGFGVVAGMVVSAARLAADQRR